MIPLLDCCMKSEQSVSSGRVVLCCVAWRPRCTETEPMMSFELACLGKGAADVHEFPGSGDRGVVTGER